MTEPSSLSTTNGSPARAHGTRGQPQVVDKTTRTAERLEREAALRRAVFLASLAGFLAAFGLVAMTGRPESSARVMQPALSGAASASNRVLAEVPVPDASGGAPMIIRIVTPEQQTTVPQARTRATP